MRFYLGTILLLFITGCSIEPVQIKYGIDQCAACRMSISDSRFGAELVTIKGKVYTFDAIECLVPELVKNGSSNYRYVLVTDFMIPETLVDAKEAIYLVSEAVPSPMGGNISAYSSHAAALEKQRSKGGEVISWTEVLERYKR